jgi:predicted dehydrogenase
MSRKSTRREFLKRTSFTGIGLWLGGGAAPSWAVPPSEKLNVGVVGVAGRGAGNLEDVAACPIANIAALCDIDEKNLYGASQKHSRARLYSDFRKLLDEGKDLDAVVVSTPDHTHAVASVWAMKAGKHVYCEKPLTHDVHEAHVVATTAKQMRRATQMGTQIHAGDNYRRVVETIQTGAIGDVTEAHAWVGKTWSGGERPAEGQPVPPHIKYDLWLGPAPERPFHETYLPANWRRWWDFGNGTLGDMGCHYLDVVHWALDLWNPIAVEAEGPPVHPETAPDWLHVQFRHPARGKLPPVTVHWYDGGRRPKQFDGGGLPEWGDGVLFVGSKGMMLADYGRYVLLPEESFKDHKAPPAFIPRSIGHHIEWLEACKTGAPTTCNFNYSGALTETVLLGVVAYRVGAKIEWDRGAMKTSNEAANRLLKREYRQGWSL